MEIPEPFLTLDLILFFNDLKRLWGNLTSPDLLRIYTFHQV